MSSIRAHITFPELKDSKAIASWNLYFDQNEIADEVETQEIFSQVKSLIEFLAVKTDPKNELKESKDQLKLCFDLIKPHFLLSWEHLGLNRYVYRLAFLLAAPGQKKIHLPGIPELKQKINHDENFRHFANYLKTTYTKSRYVREHMAYVLFNAIRNINSRSKFSSGIERDPPSSYYGSIEEEKEITNVLKEEKVADLFNAFSTQSNKYAKRFLETNEERFLEQMEICSLAMQFITKDYPAGIKVETFLQELQNRFKKDNEVWYKGGLSGFVGRHNELFHLIGSLTDSYKNKFNNKPQKPKYYSYNNDLIFWAKEPSPSERQATELVSLDQKKIVTEVTDLSDISSLEQSQKSKPQRKHSDDSSSTELMPIRKASR